MRETCAAIQPVTRSVCDDITGSSAEWFEPLDGKQRVACYISFSLHKSSCIKSYIKSKANHLCTLHWTDTAIQWKLCIWIWHLIFSCNIHFSAHMLCLKLCLKSIKHMGKLKTQSPGTIKCWTQHTCLSSSSSIFPLHPSSCLPTQDSRGWIQVAGIEGKTWGLLRFSSCSSPPFVLDLYNQKLIEKKALSLS